MIHKKSTKWNVKDAKNMNDKNLNKTEHKARST